MGAMCPSLFSKKAGQPTPSAVIWNVSSQPRLSSPHLCLSHAAPVHRERPWWWTWSHLKCTPGEEEEQSRGPLRATEAAE